MCVDARVIGSELPGSPVVGTQPESLMLLGTDPGTFSHFLLSFGQTCPALNASSYGITVRLPRGLLDPRHSTCGCSQALLRSWLVARFEALWMNGQGRAGTGTASTGEKQRGEMRRPGLLVLSKAGPGVTVAAL